VIRIIVAVVTVLIAAAAVVAAWTVLASAILCKMMGQMAAFVFPFDQWWRGLSWFHLNWQIVWLGLLNVIASGILAALPVLAIGLLLVRVTLKRPAVPVYGKTAWATREHMQAQGLSAGKNPF
jgi:hypothetical protein